MVAIRQLYDLQEVDLRLDRDRQRLQAIAVAFGNEVPLVPLRQRVREMEAAVHLAAAQQKELDQAVASIAQHIKQVEGKLYGGAVRIPRELADLQADLAQLNRQRSQQEDGLLKVLDQLDGLQKELDGEQPRLREQEIAWQQEQAAMAKERDGLQTEMAQLGVQRASMASRVSAIELALYDQVRRGHNGKAVARVERGICESCRVGLPTAQLRSVRTSPMPVRCPNCGLILLAE